MNSGQNNLQITLLQISPFSKYKLPLEHVTKLIPFSLTNINGLHIRFISSEKTNLAVSSHRFVYINQTTESKTQFTHYTDLLVKKDSFLYSVTKPTNIFGSSVKVHNE